MKLATAIGLIEVRIRPFHFGQAIAPFGQVRIAFMLLPLAEIGNQFGKAR